MTNQELYSKVRTHLLTQNRKSLDTVEHCAYRGVNGTRCAIGCLIPEENYDALLEGWSVNTGPVRVAAQVDTVIPNQRQLAMALQRVHDILPPEDWLVKLDGVAADFNLEAR